MPRWTFGDVVIDLDTHELRRGGSAVSLSPKAFQLLGILVASRPKAVTKSELQDRLWPGTFVVEKNLTNLVGEIRAALGDDPAHPRFIRTVPRFGYAFLGPATDAPASAQAAAQASIALNEPRRHNLPEPLTSFVGRDREIAELTRRLPATRLLTLTGAGGCGKTRLAVEVARNLIGEFHDGIWVVDLAPLAEPSLVVQTIASVLEVRQQSSSLSDALSTHLRGRQVLLVLDNCEHVIAPCAQLADALLRAASHLTVLATSREGLGITGETVFRVPSLSVPEAHHATPAETLAQYEAIRLFLERAAAVDPAFAVTSGNAAAVVEVCRRLDGIPLAIELAAARLKVLSIEQIHARLNDRFRLLTGGSHTALARQRTLEATVDWSYDLLTGPERRLLARLSAFAGGWTLEAAEDVCSAGGIERKDVMELLSRLVDKSLASVEDEPGGGRRYRFLETVRQYARERLVQSGEAAGLRNRHLAYFLDFARRAEPELTTADQLTWLHRLQVEHDNLRAALEWSVTAPEGGRHGLELAAALFWFWLKRAHFAEGQQWIERALAVDAGSPQALQAKALLALGNMTFFQGDFPRTGALMEQSAALAQAAGDLSLAALAVGVGAVAALQMGDLAKAFRLAAEGRAIGLASGTPWVQGPSLSVLAYEPLHDGDFERAARLHEEELDLLRQRGEKWAMTIVLFDLALLRVIQQRYGEARTLCAEGMALCQQFGDRRGFAWCLGIVAAADAAEERPLRAARLRGAMEGLLESVGAPVQPLYSRWIGNQAFEGVQRALGAHVYQEALAEGRAMSLRETIECAIQD